jgi:hypothetical protein
VLMEIKSMSYVLATTHEKVQWYKFNIGTFPKPGDFELVDQLDLRVTPRFGDKATAKLAAQALGLKTWRYVKI